MKWNHNSGFNVDNSVRIAKDDQVGLTNLAQYVIRNPFSLTKLTYNSNTAMVTYRSGKRRLRDDPWQEQKNFSINTAKEFIAAITQDIPEKSFQLVRYHGWYSNRMRGERRRLELEYEEKEGKKGKDIAELTMIDVAAYKPRRIPPPLWRDCTPRVFASRHIKKIRSLVPR